MSPCIPPLRSSSPIHPVTQNQKPGRPPWGPIPHMLLFLSATKLSQIPSNLYTSLRLFSPTSDTGSHLHFCGLLSDRHKGFKPQPLGPGLPAVCPSPAVQTSATCTAAARSLQHRAASSYSTRSTPLTVPTGRRWGPRERNASRPAKEKELGR